MFFLFNNNKDELQKLSKKNNKKVHMMVNWLYIVENFYSLPTPKNSESLNVIKFTTVKTTALTSEIDDKLNSSAVNYVAAGSDSSVWITVWGHVVKSAVRCQRSYSLNRGKESSWLHSFELSGLSWLTLWVLESREPKTSLSVQLWLSWTLQKYFRDDEIHSVETWV